jgi:23S rRNA (guanosine2251-2'-O)-methyltransferase
MKKLVLDELNRINVEEFKNADKTPIIIVLDDIRSLHNIGSVFRTSDAFLIEKIYLCGITATPPNKEIHKTALGATESVDWVYANNVMDVVSELKANQIQVFSVEQVEHSVMLNNFEVQENQKYALVFGNEVKGVQQSVIDASEGVIEIPQLGTKHSLNISVSAGIVVWDIFQKLQALKA